MPIDVPPEILTHYPDFNEVYLQPVLGADGMDLGTKLLYLERAVTQDCYTFLQSLDLLYRPINGPRTGSIHALKQLNELSENRDIQDAVTHYIRAVTDEQKSGNLFELAEQTLARLELEETLVPYSSWCFDLALPDAQSLHWLRYYSDVLPEFSDCLSIVYAYPKNACKFIQERGVSLAQLQTLAKDKQKLTLLIQYLDAMDWILHLTIFTKNKFFALDFERLFLLLSDEIATVCMINRAGIGPDIILKLPLPVLALLHDYHEAMTRLSRTRLFEACNVCSLSLPALKLVFRHEHDVLNLAKAIPELAHCLLKLDQKRLTCVLQNADNLIDLHTEEQLNVDDVLALSWEQMDTLLTAPDSDEAHDILYSSRNSLRF